MLQRGAVVALPIGGMIFFAACLMGAQMKNRKVRSLDLLSGAVFGAIATLPMTLAMIVIRRLLPKWNQGALEPHRVTSNVLQKLHITDAKTAESQTAATTIAHVGYGATSGALYAIVQRLIPIHPIVRGLCFGLGLCGASYAGWVPALGILPSPAKRPMGRNLLLVAAHAIWGSVLGYGHQAGRDAAAHAIESRGQAVRRRASRTSKATSVARRRTTSTPAKKSAPAKRRVTTRAVSRN